MPIDQDINRREYDKFDESNRVKTTSDSIALELLIDEASSTVTYLGNCLPGNAGKTDEAIWRIKKIDTTSGTKITYADGSSDFDKIWANRATYTY
jgi:hypothetical protein